MVTLDLDEDLAAEVVARSTKHTPQWVKYVFAGHSNILIAVAEQIILIMSVRQIEEALPT